jgi:hypothetical protein
MESKQQLPTHSDYLQEKPIHALAQLLSARLFATLVN